MKHTNDLKTFYRNANLSTDPAMDRAVLTDALDAGGLTCSKVPPAAKGKDKEQMRRGCESPIIIRRIMNRVHQTGGM